MGPWVLLLAAALGVLVLLRSAGAGHSGGGVRVEVVLDEATRVRCEQWRSIVRNAIDFNAAKVSTSLVLALIARESRGKETAIGDADDRGLMQITSVAWTDYINLSGDPAPPRFNDMFHAEPNTRVGVWFLQHSIDAMGSVRDGLRAYNRGVQGAKDDPSGSAEYADWILAVEPKFRGVTA